MATVSTTSAITFAVDQVEPATTLLKDCRAHEAIRSMLDSDIESCSDYHGSVVADIDYQPLLAAVYTAFSQHRPLVLTPDAVWITIAQGIAHHMAIHGERLRSRFVSHQGQLELTYEVTDWIEGSPENPWPDAFAAWSGQIRDHVGSVVHDALACDFTTSGPIERAVGDIVMMDVFQRYFHYVLVCICGIPAVTLEGTPAGWERLRDKTQALRSFEIDWWLDHLLPICDEFVRASRGDIDLVHWQGICKLRDEYGGDVVNGWVCKLFPYLREYWGGPCTLRNPVFESGEGMQTSSAPPGLSRVPFTWKNRMTGRERAMEPIGGLTGIKQEPHTLALRPKIGWAVREAPRMSVLLKRLKTEKEHATSQPAVAACAGLNRGPYKMMEMLPPELGEFYDQTDGAALFRGWLGQGFRIVPLLDVQPVERCDTQGRLVHPRGGGGQWYRLVDCDDGSCLAINPFPKRDALPAGVAGRSRHDSFAPVCHCPRRRRGELGRTPVVALSFAELLDRMLASGGKRFWTESSPDYGDASRYTR